MLLHDPRLLERPDLLRDVLAAAAPLGRDRAASRRGSPTSSPRSRRRASRIVEAGYEERRRLERDLHDGAQQRLVSLGVQIRRLQRSLPGTASILSPALDQIVGEVGAAIVDLRQIAAGVRPARLDDGLAAALRDLARSSPVPVEVEAPGGRVAASVEAAAYFVACEALTNAVKHASASKVAVRAVRENGIAPAQRLRRRRRRRGRPPRLRASPGSRTASPPTAGRSRSSARSGEGTRIEVAIPCDS